MPSPHYQQPYPARPTSPTAPATPNQLVILTKKTPTCRTCSYGLVWLGLVRTMNARPADPGVPRLADPGAVRIDVLPVATPTPPLPPPPPQPLLPLPTDPGGRRLPVAKVDRLSRPAAGLLAAAVVLPLPLAGG